MDPQFKLVYVSVLAITVLLLISSFVIAAFFGRPMSDEQKALFKPVAIELKKGECSFHHPRMIHGSYANTTGRQRRATVINVFRDGVLSNSDDPLLEGVPVIPRGERMGGQFFPLLFDPENPCGPLTR